MKTVCLCILIFILLPEFSSAVSCIYNSSVWGLRNKVLLALNDNKYIYLHDSNVTISHSKNQHPHPDIYFVKDVHFQGYIAQGDESSYVDAIMNTIKYYRYRRSLDNTCTVAFYESDDDTTIIDSNNNIVTLSQEQKAIILRLTESCIRSDLCNVGVFKVDRDGDLSFESVQSTINYFADMGIASLLKMFLNEKRLLEVSLKGSIFYEYHTQTIIELGDILIDGIEEIQRTDDVYIMNENNVYTVQFGFRIPSLNVALIDFNYNSYIIQILRYLFLLPVSLLQLFSIDIASESMIVVEGFSFNTTVIIHLESVESCSINLIDFKIVSYKDVSLFLSLGRIVPLYFRTDTKHFVDLQQHAITAVNKLISNKIIDCRTYINQLPNVLKNLL